MAKEAEVVEKTAGNLLDDFDLNDNIDFFGIKAEGSETENQEGVVRKVKEVKEEIPKKKKDAENTDASESGSESEADSELTFFEDTEAEGDDKKPEGKVAKGKDTKGAGDKSEHTGDVDDEPVDDEDEEIYTTLVQELHEKGIFSVPLADGEKVNEEKFFELHEQEVETRVDELFTEFLDEMKADEDTMAFIKFKRNGGSTAAFFDAYKEVTGLDDDLDLTNKANRKKVLTYYYTNHEGMDSEELAEKLEWLEEKGKEAEMAEKWFKKIKTIEENAKANLVKKQENDIKAGKLKTEKLISDLKAALIAGKGEADFTFSDKDSVLLNKVTKATVKLDNGRMITEFQSMLGKVMSTPTGILTLAKLLNDGFKIPEVIKKVNKEVTNETKRKITDIKKETVLRKSGTARTDKALADFFSSE